MKPRGLVFCLLIMISQIATATPITWKQLAPGFNYATISPSFASLSDGLIHIFRIDPKRYQFQIAKTRTQNKDYETIREVAKSHNAFLAVNGGIFTPELQPLGLRINASKVISPFKPISWWGVFYIANGKPYIVAARNYRYNNKISFAIQSGPRLINSSKIVPLKPGAAQRSAIGILPNNQVIILVTQNMRITTTQLAKIMQRPVTQGGLGCTYAINLDGGSSTQLYASMNEFKLDLTSFSMVADAVLVSPRS